ncbi:MAG TPA: hypothetical protein VIF60_17065, partial [Burkholderiaceae bacterium]
NLPTQQDELVFDPDSFDTETEDAPPSALSVRAEPFIAANFHRTAPQAAPDYRWEHAIFDSVRLLSTPAAGQAQAVLWDGLTAWPGKIAAARPRTIFDFGDAKAAVVRWNGDVDFYDGRKRQILAHISAQAGSVTNKVEWLQNDSMLVIDSCGRNETDNCKLGFYAIGTGKR